MIMIIKGSQHLGKINILSKPKQSIILQLKKQ